MFVLIVFILLLLLFCACIAQLPKIKEKPQEKKISTILDTSIKKY